MKPSFTHAEVVQAAADLNESVHALLYRLARSGKAEWLSEGERRFLSRAKCIVATPSGQFRASEFGVRVAALLEPELGHTTIGRQ